MGRKRLLRNYDNKGNLISMECGKCHEIKEVSEFYEDKANKYGVRTTCKECMKEYATEYSKKNADKIKEQRTKYYKKNIDKIKERQSEYNKQNADKIKEYRVEYRKQNANKIKEQQAEYYQQNVDKMCITTGYF